MLLISASDKSLKASCASIEPLSARRRRRGSDLEANEGRGRDSVDMVADEKIVDDSGVVKYMKMSRMMSNPNLGSNI